MKELYEVFPWPCRPSDPVARRRFELSIKMFDYLFREHPFFDDMKSRDSLRFLDAASATGLGGVAAVAAAVNYDPDLQATLTVSDIRNDDLRLVDEWISVATLPSTIKVNSVVADVREIHRVMKSHHRTVDVALLWGYSSPHFSPWDLNRVFASMSELLSDNGVLIMEESDRVASIFSSGYKDFLLEGTLENGTQVVSLEGGFDVFSGMYKRSVYHLPGFKQVGHMEFYPWSLASLAAVGYLFFSKVDLVLARKHGVVGGSSLILLKNPRRKIVPENLSRDLPLS